MQIPRTNSTALPAQRLEPQRERSRETTNPEQAGALAFLDADDKVSAPMTSAWMKPAAWITPASKPKAAFMQKRLVDFPEQHNHAEVEQQWHPALIPVLPSSPQLSDRTSYGPMLSFLKAGSELSKHFKAAGSAWKERSLEQTNHDVMQPDAIFVTPPQAEQRRSRAGAIQSASGIDDLLAGV
jgi:hypothetical protein